MKIQERSLISGEGRMQIKARILIQVGVEGEKLEMILLGF